LPLSQLDSNFATGITIGNTSVVLGDTIATINNLTLANVAITSVSTAFPNGYLANSNVIVGTTTLTLGSTVTSINGLSLSNVTISSGNVTISNVTTTNVTATTANVTTANVGTLTVIGNSTIGGNATVTGNVSMNVATITTANVTTTNTSSLVVTGNQTFVGTGNRITGDFSNATIASRVAFQTSTTNGNTVLNLIPNGTGTVCAFGMDTDPTFTAGATGSINLTASTDFRITSGIRGAGTYLPMTFYTGGSERVRIDTSGNVGIGISSSIAAPLQVYNATSALIQVDGDLASNIRATRYSTDTNAGSLQIRKARGTYASPAAVASGDTAAQLTFSAYGGTNYRAVGSISSVVDTFTSDTNISGYLTLNTNSGSTTVTEKMRIDSSGNVGIGSTPTAIGSYKVLEVNGTSGAYIALKQGGTEYGNIYNNSTDGTTISASGARNIIFQTNGTERMRIDSSGNAYIETGLLWQYAPTPTTKAAAATLTAAELSTDIITLTGTTYTITLPTGTALDTYYTGVPAVNIGYDFHIVNTASGTITVAVGASGMTSVGTLTVATGVSAHFRLRRTAANTFVLYRLG
jgi:hypothetical protein